MDNVPHNIDAEQHVIGSIFMDASLLDVIDLEAGEFYIHRNKFVWEAFQVLKKEKKEIDFTTVMNELDKNGDVKIDYLYEITADIPSALHAESYADIVREKAIRRQTIIDANNLVNFAYDEDSDIIERRSDVALELASTRGSSGAVPMSNWLSDGYEWLEQRAKHPREHAGISTGLGDLDRVFGDGLLPGANLLIGEPGQGKTILAQQIAVNIVKDNVPTAFYSGEMYWRDMYLRFMSGHSKQKVSDLRKGIIDFTKVVEAEEEMCKYPLWVDDPKGMKTPSLRADLIRLKSEHGIKCMVFDYLGKLKDYEGKMKEWERVERIAVNLQDILVELDIAGLVVHQVTKSGYDKQDIAGIAGGKDVGYEVVCAVQILKHDEDNLRKIINIKPPRGVEGYWKYCELFKDPLFPSFSQVVQEDNGYVPHYSDDI